MRHRTTITPELKKEIIRQYTTRLPDGTWKGATLIGRELGISQPTVSSVLRQNEIPIRNAKEAHAHGKRCGPIKHTEQLGNPPLCACGCETPTHWARSKYRWAKYVRGHYRQDAPYKDEQWLHEQYVMSRRGLSDIASECGVNPATIIHYMERFGIVRRNAHDAHKGIQAGDRNPAWKGGVTPERQRLYKQGGWREFVKKIYARDNYTCQRCQQGISGNQKRGAAAHHIKPWAGHPELRFDPANIVTLCKACHHWVHSKQNTTRAFIE